MPDIPSIDLGPIEASFRQMSEVLDLAKTEGVLDRLFDRPDHRIAVKTERALRLAEYRAALTCNIGETRKAIEEMCAVNRARFALAAEAYTAEERFNHARNAAARQDPIDAAKAKAEIAKYLAEAELARRSALPPPPTPPEPPAVDEATRKREEARRMRRDKLDLAREERAERADAAQQLVADAKASCEAIYHDKNALAGEQRERIRKVLDSYGFDSSILPPRLQELMEEALPEDAQ